MWRGSIRCSRRTDWVEQEEFSNLIQKPLTEIAYFYLTQEKNKLGQPLNPVANFHLGNGATVSLNHIHFAANRSRERTVGILRSNG